MKFPSKYKLYQSSESPRREHIPTCKICREKKIMKNNKFICEMCVPERREKSLWKKLKKEVNQPIFI